MRSAGLRRCVLLFSLFLILAGLALAPGMAGAETEASQVEKPTVVRELPELRTENSKTYLLSNGARQAVIYSSPIQFKDEKGTWKDIDTSLVSSADGSLVSSATPVEVKLTKKDEGAPVVSLAYKGASVELVMNDLTFEAPDIDGSTASYGANVATDSGPALDTTTEPPVSSTTTAPPSTTASSSETTVTTPISPEAGPAAAVPQTEASTTESTADSTTDTTAPPEDTTTVSAPEETTTSVSIPAEETTTTAPAKGSDLSLSYEVLPSGVKENIILASASAPSTYTFTLRHPGLILRKDHTGRWGFYDELENPDPLFVLGPLFVFDARVDHLGGNTPCPDATMTVTPGSAESEVTISVPASWISDPARVFPVTIDPSVVTRPVASDTFITSGYPSTAYGSSTWSPVGYSGPAYYWSTPLIQFALPADLSSGGFVQSAHFQIYQYYTHGTGAETARASAMTASWSTSSTYSSLGSHTWFGSDTRTYQTSGAQTEWLDFDFTSTVQAWADGTKPNYGFTLYHSQNDVDTNHGWRQVYLSEYTGGGGTLKPKLVVTYTPQIDASLAPYSADKTGASDATTAIQNAINAAETAGGMVYLPAGNYKVSGLELDHSNLVLKGSGTNTRLIVSSPTQACTLQIGGATAVSNVTVKDLYVRLPAQGDGIRLTGTGGGSNITLTNLAVGGGADSSTTRAINVSSNFTDLTITGNDLSGVTALPWDYSASATRAALSGNGLGYEPYRADFFGGSDRYETAIHLSQVAFPNGLGSGQAAVVARGDLSKPPLVAGPLAKAYSGPLLLNSSYSTLDAVVVTELGRLHPDTIFLVGLSDSVVTAVKDALPAASVTKLTGADDYTTATAVATQLKTKLGSVTRVCVVPSDYTAGSTTVAAIAAKNGWPILYTPRNGPLPTATSNWYTANMTTPKALEVGTSVTLTGISGGNLKLIDGASGDWDAGQVADYATTAEGGSCTYAQVAVTNNADWANADLAGPYVAKEGGILLTTGSGSLSSEVSSRLKANFAALDEIAYLNLPGFFVADENPGLWLPGAARHTTYDLSSFADHGFEAILDESALSASITDLEIASLGPRAALDRYYSSTSTTAGYFAPGWRFGFERKLDLSQQTSGRIDYVDEEGEVYSFVGKTGTDGGIGLPVQTTWMAPPGFNAALRKEPYSYWKLSLPGGTTLTFTADGKLASEEDANLNMTQYSWTAGGDPEGIYAQNGQCITLTVVSHKLSGASYTTAAGTRTVSYATASPWTVTYSYSGTPTTASRSLTYGYTSNLLTTLTATAYTSLGNSVQTFAYSGGALTNVYYPDYVAGTNTDPRADIAYNANQATITTHGRVYSTSVPTGETGSNGTLTQTFTWNPAGTMASKTNPKISGSDETWTYTYSPLTNYLTSETSPLTKTKSWTYNNRGNLTSETDEAGHTTTWTYPDRDPLAAGMIQAYVAYNEDDVYNADSALRTDRVTQAIGHGSAVDSPGWRFRNLQIPKGAVITQARLYLAAYYVPDGDMGLLSNRFGAEAADNPGLWVAGTHEPRVGYSQLTSDETVALSLRPGDENDDPLWIPPNYSQSHDFHTSVQEVVAGVGWTPGNSMAIIAQDAGTPAVNFINCYDSSGGKPAILRIWYGLKLDPDPKWDMPTVKTDPRGHKTYYSYDKRGNLIETKQDVDATSVSATRYVYKDLDSENYWFMRVLKQTQSLVSGAWTNRFTQTNEFDNAAWAKTRSGVFANVMEGPLGRDVSADKLVENNGAGTHTIGQTVSVTSGKTYRISVYARMSERYQAAISFPSTGFSAATAVFDIDGGTVLSSTCENAGIDYMLEEGWYRMWAEKTATSSTSATITLGTALNGAVSYTGTGHSTPKSSDPGIYLWGAECLDVTTPVVVTTTYDTNSYWSNGQPKQVQTSGVALGNGTSPTLTASQSYDEFGNLTSKSNTAGQTAETNTYDLAGRLLTSTGPSFTATPLGGSATSTQLVGRHTYDAWGHETESFTTSTGEAAQSKASWLTTAYDKAGRPSQVKSKLTSGTIAATRDLTYDGLGRLIQTADTTVSGLPALTAYDARGNVVASWLGGACTGSYDLAQASRSLNADNTPAYDAVGRVLRSAPPGDNPTTFTYTDDNRVLRETKPDGTWTENTYDENGNVTHTKTSKSSPSYLTTAVYDYANRLTSLTDGNNLTTTYTYDLLGRQITAGTGAGTSAFTYNALGWQLQIQDADSFTTSRIFDSAGRVTQETTASYQTSFTYNATASPLLTQKDEADTHRTQLKYDWFARTNREIHSTTSPSATYKDTSLTYDSLGRVLTSTDNLRQLTHGFSYPENTAAGTTDAYGIGASGSDLVSTTLTIGADGLEASRASTITSSPQVPGLTRTIDPATGRDNAKRVTKATLETDTSRFIYAQYAFDSAGRIQKQWGPDSGDGSGYLAGALTTNAYTYDATSGLKTADNLQLQSVGMAGAITSSYTYTTNGRLATAQTNGVTETDTFDAAGNLTSIGTGTSLTYSSNRLSTMTAGGQTTYFFFDSAKRWRTVEAPTNNQNDPNRTAFTYTGTGRLASWTKYTGGSASTTATYTYDAQGQRTKSVVDDQTSGLVTTTDFAYQGLLLQSLSASQTGTGATSWKITYLYDEYGKPYGGIYRNPGSSDDPIIFGMVTTDRGDVVELLDAAGDPFAAYRYDAWGNPQGAGNVGTGIWVQQNGTALISESVATAIATRQVLRYASYCYDSESGLYYLSARSYDPVTRQFLSKDLSRNDGEQSAYQYCLGNPVKYTDATGFRVDDDGYRAAQIVAARRMAMAYAGMREVYKDSIRARSSLLARIGGGAKMSMTVEN